MVRRLAALIALAALPACRSLPVYSTLPPFELTDQTGHPFGSAELDGKVWVANFIFTRCPTVCPAFTAKMEKIQAGAKEQGLAIHLVSFSIDPGFDTPEVMTAYAAAHGADPATWTFVTGPPDALQEAIVKGLKIAAKPVGPDEDLASVFHGTHFVLVDAHGRIRGYYDSSAPDVEENVLRDAAHIM